MGSLIKLVPLQKNSIMGLEQTLPHLLCGLNIRWEKATVVGGLIWGLLRLVRSPPSSAWLCFCGHCSGISKEESFPDFPSTFDPYRRSLVYYRFYILQDQRLERGRSRSYKITYFLLVPDHLSATVFFVLSCTYPINTLR